MWLKLRLKEQDPAEFNACVIFTEFKRFKPNLCWRINYEVEGNSPCEDYFCHLSQNGIKFLSRQVWLIGLNKSEKSRRREVIVTHVFDHVA